LTEINKVEDYKTVAIKYLNFIEDNKLDSAKSISLNIENDYIDKIELIRKLNNENNKSPKESGLKYTQINDTLIECSYNPKVLYSSFNLIKFNDKWKIEHFSSPALVSEVFLRSLSSNEYDISRILVDKETLSIIDLFEHLHKNENAPNLNHKTDFNKIDCKALNDSICDCSYMKNNTLESLTLNKNGNNWLIHMPKESPTSN
jgi:hypothetical protein